MNQDEKFKVAPHACRVCLGRILERTDEDGIKHVRCAQCGAESAGGHRALCCCGVKLRSGRSAGIKCVLNQDKRPELPDEIVVLMAGEEVSPRVAQKIGLTVEEE